jgi:hypothetical protein
MRSNTILIILAVSRVVAMVLTLLHGREHGRHGYGLSSPDRQQRTA